MLYIFICMCVCNIYVQTIKNINVEKKTVLMDFFKVVGQFVSLVLNIFMMLRCVLVISSCLLVNTCMCVSEVYFQLFIHVS